MSARFSDSNSTDEKEAVEAEKSHTSEITTFDTPCGQVNEVFDHNKFHSATTKAKSSQRYGPCVTIFSPDALRMDEARMFMSANGAAFVAVTGGGEVINAVRHKTQSSPEDFKAVMFAAIHFGNARFLECMDTIIVPVYMQYGFVPVARVPWDDRFAPHDWDKKLFAKFNHGEPHYTYMVLDTINDGLQWVDGMPSYNPNDVPIMSSQDADRRQIDRVFAVWGVNAKKVAGSTELMQRYYENTFLQMLLSIDRHSEKLEH